MKAIVLLYGVSMLAVCYAMIGDNISKKGNPLASCGITEEKDATLFKCLSDFREKQRKAMEILKNNAGVNNYSEIHQLFRESVKCFSGGSSKEKTCYLATVLNKFGRQYQRKGHEIEILNAAIMYKSYQGYIEKTFDECKMNKDTAPFLISCLREIVPKARKIMAEKVSYESYKRMFDLISGTTHCYMKITSEQSACLVKQNEVHKTTQVELIKKESQLMIQKLKDCNISAEKIEAVSACVKPKATEMLKFAFEMFKKPELIEKVWNLSEDMKKCFDKYPEVKRCVNVQKHDRPGRHEQRMMNPFHFENVTNGLMQYIHVKSKNMLGECKIKPTEMPKLFICLGKKYKENKDVQSKDPKTKFIGMMRLMNTSAECFINVTKDQGLCLWKNKEEMVKFVNSKAELLGKIMAHLLGACNATSDMVSCVDGKKTKLQELAKTMLTNPDNAETIWDLGTGLKSCLTDATIKKCVLSKKDKSQEGSGKGRRGCSSHGCYGEMSMQKHIEEKSKKMFAECNLTPENSPAVFMCLKRKFDESEMKTLKDPKQIFISGMKLMNTSALCFKNATSEQKSCLLDKKNEMQGMISETSDKFQKVMDGVLLSCGVSKTKTPELVQCIQPKRDSLMKLVPDLLNNPAIAEPAWELMEEAKKCFESKPEIAKCLKQKNMDYFMTKFGKKKQYVPHMEITEKIRSMLKKCDISAESTPKVYACMQTKVENLKVLMGSKDMTASEKMVEFNKLRMEGMKCLETTDDKRKECVEESSRSFQKVVPQKFQKSSSGFNLDTVMKRMDDMLTGCGITSEKTPQLKSCLDDRTNAVMKIKPWIPMDNEAREKLKAEGVKYWKCFGDGQNEELKCMQKIVEGFKTQGKKFAAARMGKFSDLMNKKIDGLIGNVTTQVLACSPNECFQKKVKMASEQMKTYWQTMKAAKGDPAKKVEIEKLRKKIPKSLMQSMFCISSFSSLEKAKTFMCLEPIINKTTIMVKKMLPNVQQWNPRTRDESQDREERLQRNKRDTTEDNPLQSLLDIVIGERDDSSVNALQSFMDKQSMDRIQVLFNLMRTFISECTSWGPPPEMADRRRNDDMPQARKIIDHGGLRRLASRPIIDHGGLPARPPSEIMDVLPSSNDENFGKCKSMYDNINFVVNNGQQMRTQPVIHHDNHVSTAVIVAACTGSIVVVILILLVIIVIFVTRRRCSSHAASGHAPPASAPQADTPSVYGAFPTKETPPSYNEIHNENQSAASAVYSQVLDTSMRGGTEKSC